MPLLIKLINGITLPELIITLATISILAIASIPGIRTLVQNHRLSSTTLKLYHDLQYARSEAIKNNQVIYITLQTGDNWCYGLSTTAGCNCALAGNCNLGTVNAATSQQISLSTNGFSSGLQFEGSHGAANASGTITMTLYGQTTSMTIQVGRLGNLQLCSTGLSGYTAC